MEILNIERRIMNEEVSAKIKINGICWFTILVKNIKQLNI